MKDNILVALGVLGIVCAGLLGVALIAAYFVGLGWVFGAVLGAIGAGASWALHALQALLGVA